MFLWVCSVETPWLLTLWRCAPTSRKHSPSRNPTPRVDVLFFGATSAPTNRHRPRISIRPKRRRSCSTRMRFGGNTICPTSRRVIDSIYFLIHSCSMDRSAIPNGNYKLWEIIYFRKRIEGRERFDTFFHESTVTEDGSAAENGLTIKKCNCLIIASVALHLFVNENRFYVSNYWFGRQTMRLRSLENGLTIPIIIDSFFVVVVFFFFSFFTKFVQGLTKWYTFRIIYARNWYHVILLICKRSWDSNKMTKRNVIRFGRLESYF